LAYSGGHDVAEIPRSAAEAAPEQSEASKSKGEEQGRNGGVGLLVSCKLNCRRERYFCFKAARRMSQLTLGLRWSKEKKGVPNQNERTVRYKSVLLGACVATVLTCALPSSPFFSPYSTVRMLL
jgi:hypothetical protein